MYVQLLWELLALCILLIVARILFVIHKITTGHSKKVHKLRIEPCKAVICIGSGGHTTEMLQLVRSFDFKKYYPRYYILASSDTTSYTKVIEIENMKQQPLISDNDNVVQKNNEEPNYKIIRIPRSRSVGQSYITSVYTTLISFIYCIPVIFGIVPDLILCNGPGTCIPICGLGFILKCAFIKDVRIMFIESFCRTQTLSLSGNILMYMADNFLVQWPSLKHKIKRSEYIGKLM